VDDGTRSVDRTSRPADRRRVVILCPGDRAPLTDAIKANAGKLAAANGLRIDYVRKKNFRKEDRVEASAVAHRTQ
jgi:hypothetical protein